MGNAFPLASEGGPEGFRRPDEEDHERGEKDGVGEKFFHGATPWLVVGAPAPGTLYYTLFRPEVK